MTLISENINFSKISYSKLCAPLGLIRRKRETLPPITNKRIILPQRNEENSIYIFVGWRLFPSLSQFLNNSTCKTHSPKNNNHKMFLQFVLPKIQGRHLLPQRVWILFFYSNCPPTLPLEDEIELYRWCNVKTQTLPTFFNAKVG